MKLNELATKNKKVIVAMRKWLLKQAEEQDIMSLLKECVFSKIDSMEFDSNNISYEYNQGGWYIPKAIKSVMYSIYDSGEIPEKYIEATENKNTVDSIAEWLWNTAFKRLKVCWTLSNMSKYDMLDKAKLGSCTTESYEKGYYDDVINVIKSLGYDPNDLVKLLKFNGYYSHSNLYSTWDTYEECPTYVSKESWERNHNAYVGFTTHDAFVKEIVEVAEAL